MSRYIDADALLEKYNVKGTNTAECLIDKKMARAFERFCIIADAVEKQPTVDAVPVVRCMECKYMRESVDGLFKSGYFCERCHITSDMENCDDFYCADGERRSL